jgi:hypothetical protein
VIVFWPINQQLSIVLGIFDAKGESIFNTLSDRLAEMVMHFLFISFGNHQLRDQLTIAE